MKYLPVLWKAYKQEVVIEEKDDFEHCMDHFCKWLEIRGKFIEEYTKLK